MTRAFPATQWERQPAERALQAAWDAPDGDLARSRLEALAEGWQTVRPGASARLRSAIRGTTAVQALASHGVVAERLRTSTPAAHLLAQCLPAARQRTGRAWIATAAAEALRRQAGFRRLSGSASLEHLMGALAERAGAGIPSTTASRQPGASPPSRGEAARRGYLFGRS